MHVPLKLYMKSKEYPTFEGLTNNRILHIFKVCKKQNGREKDQKRGYGVNIPSNSK